jgi:hypothetical protein
MSSPIMGKFKIPFLRWWTKIFSDDQLSRSVTYNVCTGRDINDELTMTSLTLKAICNQDRIFASVIPTEIKIQAGERVYVLWTYTLSAGLTVDSFTTDDRIVDGGKEYVIVEMNKSPRSIVMVKVTGS